MKFPSATARLTLEIETIKPDVTAAFGQTKV